LHAATKYLCEESFLNEKWLYPLKHLLIKNSRREHYKNIWKSKTWFPRNNRIDPQVDARAHVHLFNVLLISDNAFYLQIILIFIYSKIFLAFQQAFIYARLYFSYSIDFWKSIDLLISECIIISVPMKQHKFNAYPSNQTKNISQMEKYCIIITSGTERLI
jgi:hypothetical protein